MKLRRSLWVAVWLTLLPAWAFAQQTGNQLLQRGEQDGDLGPARRSLPLV